MSILVVLFLIILAGHWEVYVNTGLFTMTAVIAAIFELLWLVSQSRAPAKPTK